MPFKSDRQRKGFFAGRGNPKVAMTPTITKTEDFYRLGVIQISANNPREAKRIIGNKGVYAGVYVRKDTRSGIKKSIYNFTDVKGIEKKFGLKCAKKRGGR